MHGGAWLWWRVQSRNKRLVTAELRTPKGQALVRRLSARSDVLSEKFRPGTLERWGLDPEELRTDHPELVVVRISGFGQTGPYRSRTGLGIVAEAMGGIRYLTGHPGGPTSRTRHALPHETPSLFAANGTLPGLVPPSPARRRDVVDVAL